LLDQHATHRHDGQVACASREALTARKDQGMALWRDKLFLFLSRNATPATEYFGIPGNRLVELGMHVAI
jgi:KUP system potassium uptake protein